MVGPLDHKLLRDLARMKGQAIAIGAVICVGVMMLIMMTGLVASLKETRDAYYSRYRLADIFAPVARAPERVISELGDIRGVSFVQGRVSGRALIDLENQVLPVQARALSLPLAGEASLNEVYLTAGRIPDRGRPDEILLLNSFARANELTPGMVLKATMNGAKRAFRVTGLAQSPEFIYTTAPGELVPDDARFGVIWMHKPGLASAYDLEGAFNEALLTLARNANKTAVLDAADRILSPYGGSGAYLLADQFSNRFVTEEIGGLEAAAKVVPPVFLAVAAFLLYIVINRMVQSEREEIGLLKAFGYTNSEVGAHYFRMVLIIAAGGAAAGCLSGIALGRLMADFYIQYYKFPFLVFQISPGSVFIGFTVSVLASSAGGLMVLRKVFRLAPAEAMRPPAPADFSGSGHFTGMAGRLLDQPGRMVLRRLTRHPGRMAGAVTGIASGMGLCVAMLTIYAGFDRTIDLTFNFIDRSDMLVSFTHAADDKTLYELARIPGVEQAEGTRSVPVVFSNGLTSHRGALTGIPSNPELSRPQSASLETLALPQGGVVLSQPLAAILNIRPGETLLADVREGRQPILEIPVAGVASSLLGSPAYIDLAYLNRIIGEPGRVSGAFLSVETGREEEISLALQEMTVVAGVSVKRQAQEAFVRIMDTGAGAVRYVMGLIAFIITFGIIYNTARIAYAERQRDLASLRVIGFTRTEAAFVLLGELAVVTLLALPVGAALGYFLSFAIAAGFSTELYQIPVVTDPESYGLAILIVSGASVFSGWLVKRDLDGADLVEALKTRE